MKRWQFIYALRNAQPGHQIVYFNCKLLYPFLLFLFDVFDDINIWIIRDVRIKIFTVG